jgi:dihydrofolate reductase
MASERVGYVCLATSSDGFIAREDGGLEWLDQFYDPSGEGDLGFFDFLNSCQAMVMGRKTFDVVCKMPEGPWPYEELTVYVVTRQPVENVVIPQHLSSKNIHVRQMTASNTLKQLLEYIQKEHAATKVYIDGGQTVREGLKSGLIEQMLITKVPMELGSGIPLFNDSADWDQFKIADSKTLKNGSTQVTYKVKKDSSD